MSMNTHTLYLSSTTTFDIQTVTPLKFEDHTRLTLDLTHINERYIPKFIKIDWGYGQPVIFDNDLYTTWNNSVNTLKFSPLLTNTYTYEYYPSDTSLYKSLTAQVLISYANGDITWIKIPMTIRTNDYFESVYDLTLLNTKILPVEANNKEHQLISSVSDYLIEIQQH